jgi:hypothetical protein
MKTTRFSKRRKPLAQRHSATSQKQAFLITPPRKPHDSHHLPFFLWIIRCSLNSRPFRGLQKLFFFQKVTSVGKFSHKKSWLLFLFRLKIKKINFSCSKIRSSNFRSTEERKWKNSVEISLPFKKRSQKDRWSLHSNHEIGGGCLYRVGA